MFKITPNQNISNGTEPMRLPANRQPSGMGYVILSRAYDRQTYIDNCYRNNTITIITGTGEILKDCMVEKSTWQHLNFPISYKERGSAVVWLNIPVMNRAVIVGVVSKRDEISTAVGEGVTNVGRHNREATAETTYSDDKVVTTTRGNSQETGHHVYIFNDGKEGTYKVYVQGTINFESEKEFNSKSTEGFRLIVTDEEVGSAVSEFNYVTGVGYLMQDEFGNKLRMTNDGFEVLDIYGNRVFTTDEGVLIDDANGNSITTDKAGVHVKVKTENKIQTIGDGLEQDSGTLAGKLIDVLTTMIDKMAEICQNISSHTGQDTVTGAPVVTSPITVSAVTQLQGNIELIKKDLDGIKSKTVKLT